jgi:hypothetical protein
MAQVTGRVFIKINGEMQHSKPGAKLMFGGKTRTPVVGDDAVHGYAEKLTEPRIECTFSHTANTSVQALADISDATVTFETDTGKAFILRNAFVTDPPELTGGEGELAVKFAAVSAEEM